MTTNLRSIMPEELKPEDKDDGQLQINDSGRVEARK